MTSKNGGSFNAYDIQSNGCYVEYSGTQNQGEFVLQSWSGEQSGQGFTKRNRHSKWTLLRKVSLANCKSAFGTSDFGSWIRSTQVQQTAQ
ncbi:MAG: hypothetical protein ACLTCP_09525 [Ruminococcus bicirculans (ex Wegman et al. 2014)]